MRILDRFVKSPFQDEFADALEKVQGRTEAGKCPNHPKVGSSWPAT